ncbi:MAG: HAMP domain-containing sensor histidine kinase [Rubripirellula sp.]|nr:HAMP domain-containing sensor histidine kinase [Rubripirellula sp.]
MPKRLLFALLLLVAAPLVLLGWLSASAHQQQQRQAREQLSLFFRSRLGEIDRSLSEVIDTYERSLRAQLDERAVTLDALRQIDLETPIVRSSIYVNQNGVLVYPLKPQPEQSEKVALFAALPAIIRSRPELGSYSLQTKATLPTKRSTTGKTLPPSRSLPPSLSQSNDQAPVSEQGIVGEGKWQVWYMDEGVQLIYWMQHSEGAIIGVLLERARWIADLTTQLPDTVAVTPVDNRAGEPSNPMPASQSGSPGSTQPESIAATQSGFTALTDEANRIVYRWGEDGRRLDQPLAALNLAPPLANWQLEYHHRDSLAGPSPTVFLVAPIVGTGLILLSLGIYVLTNVQRQMRSARQRVSFASQVSHELRTPLTNIRLYAELAESDLQTFPDGQTKESVSRRLKVIDTETRRLSRLVSGVLEMIRDPRKQREPRISNLVPDDVINQTITQFMPSFEKAELQVHRQAEASQTIGIDSDILELILVNLLSNVEKYAACGGSVTVSSKIKDDQLTIEVFDQGPGIPWHARKRIFRPFMRLDDSIQAPSGTGIGLTLARQLARRHGGDLELVQDETHQGACFRLQIKISPTKVTQPPEAPSQP